MMRTIKPIELTESSIQAALFKDLVSKGHSHIAPNCMALGYEADLLSLTTSDYVHEYEIKISRSDFKADQNKKNKHYIYQNAEKGFGPARIPSRLYYVIPAGMVSIEEVPTHAGLIEIKLMKTSRPYLAAIITKPAPRLHSEKAPVGVKHKITTSLMWKVFNGVVKE